MAEASAASAALFCAAAPAIAPPAWRPKDATARVAGSQMGTFLGVGQVDKRITVESPLSVRCESEPLEPANVEGVASVSQAVKSIRIGLTKDVQDAWSVFGNAVAGC